MGKRNSVLTIDSVSDKHAGNFTCQATNSAASANFTSQLIVNGVHTDRKKFSFNRFSVGQSFYSVLSYLIPFHTQILPTRRGSLKKYIFSGHNYILLFVRHNKTFCPSDGMKKNDERLCGRVSGA